MGGKRIAVVGLGNILMGDDGVGIHVVRELINRNLPPSVSVFEMGALGPEFFDIVSDYEKVIVVDGVKFGGKPGTVYKLSLADIMSKMDRSECDRQIISLHDLGSLESLFVISNLCPEVLGKDIILIGIEVKRIEKFCDKLSPEVERAVAVAVKEILEEIHNKAEI
ncbi:MAG: hydrogenase maturation protease [Candidatus Baldrarchaeia archaeon]